MEVWTKRLFQIIVHNLELVQHQRKNHCLILENVEAISAAAGCTLQLISIRVPFPKD